MPNVKSAQDLDRILYPLTSHLRLPTLCLLQEVLGAIGTLFGGSVVLTDLRHTATVGPAIVAGLRLGAALVGDNGTAPCPPGQAVFPADCFDLWLHGARAMGALWRALFIEAPPVGKLGTEKCRDISADRVRAMCGVAACDSPMKDMAATHCKANFIAMAPKGHPGVQGVSTYLLYGRVRASGPQ